jgi:hypothetical protein
MKKAPSLPPTLAVGAYLDAPASVVWRLIADTHAWPRWGPSVQAVDCPERFVRSGLTGRIQTVFGVWLPFRVGSCEPGRYWDWRVGPVAATGHRVEPKGPHHCTLTFTVPVWAAVYSAVCRIAIQRIKHLLPPSHREDEP